MLIRCCKRDPGDTKGRDTAGQVGPQVVSCGRAGFVSPPITEAILELLTGSVDRIVTVGFDWARRKDCLEGDESWRGSLGAGSDRFGQPRCNPRLKYPSDRSPACS
ncbi:hypothetical protein BHE74_00052107 [Ensete ventricosum]|nr:hypothetical protein BHE74_00052107 [Ensete ventricosum]